MKTSLSDYQKYEIEKGPVIVEHIKVMHGANYFSGGPIVLLRINLGAYDEVFSNQIDGFFDKLSTLLPSLYEHHCSIGKPGGFFTRVQEGTLLGHIIEHVAIELQTMAGMAVNYGKTRSTLQQGVYNVIFRFFDELAGVYAGKAAVNIINAILLNKDISIPSINKALIDIREQRLFGPSTQAIVDEAISRNIPHLRIDSYNLVQLGTGKYHKRIRATITSDTNLIAVETADNKYLCNLMLKDAGIPVPISIKTCELSEIIDFYNNIKQPIILKPIFGNLGKQLTNKLDNIEAISNAFKLLQIPEPRTILAQQYYEGKAYRLLIIDYKFVAATMLEPPIITGDGKHTIVQLIAKLNENPDRQFGDKGKLSLIALDTITENILKNHQLTPESILPENYTLPLKYSGNPKLGGTSTDVTELVHPLNIFLAERAAKVLGLNVAGVDIISPDISISMFDNEAIILEINAAPDFRMHINPTTGLKRNVAAPLLDMLFPAEKPSRIPIFSITGTVGKTICASIINHCLKAENLCIGLTTNEGLFIGGKRLMKGDMTYPEHVALVLKDPTIDCAILETSREGILRSGLGYQLADYGIVLNMHNDHVGSDDIKYLEDLAYAKSVVAEQVYEEGYTILNADNDLVLEMKERLYSKLIVFSHTPDNKFLQSHIFRGGLAVYIKENHIVISFRNNHIQLIALNDIPLTFNNTAKFTYDAILAAVAALYAHKISKDKIAEGLKSFIPNTQNLQGRLNLMDVLNFKVLLDYAHNAISFNGLKDFLASFNCLKIGVFDAAGDRQDEEIAALGSIAAETYNELYIYEGIDARGRNKGEVIELLKQGALSKAFPENKIHSFTSPQEAWLSALSNAPKDCLVTILTARGEETTKVIEQFIAQNNIHSNYQI